jgi:hypothetical protein
MAEIPVELLSSGIDMLLPSTDLFGQGTQGRQLASIKTGPMPLAIIILLE